MPSSAIFIRFSKPKGLVTTATVRIPISFAKAATTGAAPVPVPPPIPAVIKAISAPDKTSDMRSRSSTAACLPTSGLVPAPRPLVTVLPICKVVLASKFFSACASVLAAINSTPSTFLASMCCTALPPPPPTPITLITALCGALSTNSNIAFSC